MFNPVGPILSEVHYGTSFSDSVHNVSYCCESIYQVANPGMRHCGKFMCTSVQELRPHSRYTSVQ